MEPWWTRFSATGEFIFQLPDEGVLGGIATDSSGDVWIASYKNFQFKGFSNAVENTLSTSVSGGQEGFIVALAVDSEDNLYTIGGTK